MLLDVPGALWKLEDIDKGRRTRAPDGLVRIVVGIDPAVSSHESSDETGIIVAGKNDRGHAYILEDLSGKYAPDAWARTAISAYHGWRADRIVAEVNQGGALVEATLRMVDPNVPYTAVRSAGGTGGRDHHASRRALRPGADPAAIRRMLWVRRSRPILAWLRPYRTIHAGRPRQPPLGRVGTATARGGLNESDSSTTGISASGSRSRARAASRAAISASASCR